MGRWTLHGENGTGAGDVVASHGGAHVVGVRGIRHHVEHRLGVVGVPPHDDVVEHRRVGVVEEMGVLGAPGADLAEVVGQRVLDDVEGAAPLQPHGAEMRHVEDRRRRAAGHVFGDRARRIGDRHLPATELGHGCAELSVRGVERGSLQRHR